MMPYIHPDTLRNEYGETILATYLVGSQGTDTLDVHRTKESIRTAVFEYVHCFYNGTRTQKRLGYMSPRQLFNSLRMKRLAVKHEKRAA